jgi:hypothetical protein
MSVAMQFLEQALVLSRSCENYKEQAGTLRSIATVKCGIGHYQAARMLAHEA